MEDARTITADAAGKIGETITLKGWVAGRRDHGKLIFIDLRDRWGMVQVVFTPADKELLAAGDRLRSEWVVEIRGLVKERPKGMENPELPTGRIEIEATRIEILNAASTPEFALDTDGREISEEHRMQYRYLDLRRERMKNNLIMRDRVITFIRDYLHKKDFIEIETPILTKSTPEGARDYVVPSRLYPKKFYALPQSPQQYKQLLMVAGIEQYFQIARCLRDEDTRGDRQPEFTQLDLEMSFVEQEDILNLIEKMYTELVKKLYPNKHITYPHIPIVDSDGILTEGWRKITYYEVMERYGTDKPDLRRNKSDPDELAFAWIVDFPLFEKGKIDGHFAPSHHMFTAPKKTDAGKIYRESPDFDPASARSYQHDLVLNGYEIAGGSMRIHDPIMQKWIFELIGFSDKQKEEFKHLIAAFQYGVPPHGGIASGLDRLLMILQNEPNIREVIAFPKTGDGRDLMMDAPAEISEAQLKELGLRVGQKR